MIANTLTLDIENGESGEQVSPLERIDIIEYIFSTFAVLVMLSVIFAQLQIKPNRHSQFLYPENKASKFYTKIDFRLYILFFFINKKKYINATTLQL